ncbi:VWA domain-containing protein [Roseibium aggregatum]|uniref:VPLPA-CTERM sorting domain-containing protein n=1 Tax=Roseibium aggregatum TaxID=187304 RepID=A0A939EBH4_9HYPH|nr:VWA domain-containing protein [Roseibium aggregatum]MBN9669562.1 VPLPA-CTERM sorting domain-containing protein [Roseibium aggregatum]
MGTTVSPAGQANASGTIGGGLDLVIVMDSSGSMGSTVPISGNPSRRQVQQDAATALVNSLPSGSAVSIVDFDSSASVTQGLTELPTGLGSVTTAISNINASGGTNIAAGIAAADGELDANGRSGTSKQILVISDGGSSQTAAENAAAAAAADGYTVNTVSFPGASTSTMEAVAIAGGGTFVNFSSNPQDIVDIFSGSGGGVLVGVSGVQITDPDGNSFAAIVDALGNFTVPGFSLNAGANTWTALASFTDGSTASASLTLYGTSTTAVPLPASGLLLFAAVGGLGAMRLRRKKA